MTTASAATNELDDIIDASDMTLDDLLADLMADALPVDSTGQTVTAERASYCEQTFAMAVEDAKREGILTFDVETVPDETRFPRPKLPEPIAMGAALDAILNDVKNTVPQIVAAITNNLIASEIDKIEASERKGKARDGVFKACKASRGNTSSPQLDAWTKLALSPIGCRIVAFGWSVGRGPVRSFVATNDAEERLLLGAWWELVDGTDRQHCGFNTLSFDLGVLGFRSLILGVEPSKVLNRSKYSNRDAIDLYVRLFPGGSPGGCDCKSICRALGIEIPAGNMDGSQVLGLWDAGDFDGIGQYVESDVTIERELFYRTADVFGDR